MREEDSEREIQQVLGRLTGSLLRAVESASVQEEAVWYDECLDRLNALGAALESSFDLLKVRSFVASFEAELASFPWQGNESMQVRRDLSALAELVRNYSAQ